MTDTENKVVAYTGGPKKMHARNYFETIKGILDFHGCDLDENQELVREKVIELEGVKNEPGVLVRLTIETIELHEITAHTNI